MLSQLLQICIEYSTIPPLDAITLDEIRFFYGELIGDLCKMQKAIKKGKPHGK